MRPVNGKGILLLLFLFLPLTACTQAAEDEELVIGLLLTYEAGQQEWNERGYEAVHRLEEDFGAEVHIRENTKSPGDVRQAVRELEEEGVSLLFGHGAVYADMFMNLKDTYPDVHFVTFNEPVSGENITSVHFEGYAMGYFAGMLAAEQSETGRIAAVGAYPYQPEIHGFADGADYQQSGTEIALRFTESWVDREAALSHLKNLPDETDVVYAAGDGFHQEIIEQAEKADIYTIGYLGDNDSDGEMVLTSTVQHVEKLYEETASEYVDGTLKPGNRRVDFQDGFISLGAFGPAVDEETKEWLEHIVEEYKETGLLPHEQET
ncbi:BMP family ABC transporter substrate-binding protein [Alkalicoccus saliphilus]|uniref:BMP family ABC transporter substrate-binding protein n=1 Tax=Alkalicoccus saliphilus TaxID=200989 RepID=A0A2T4U3S5_9BACI|nr:BMP family ABC transporter substrate-binding protein [Alkalicoccus saliphilus]